MNIIKRTREPKQERSIEKKNRIIKAGYELFSEVGYYGTNTAEIAKRAGVSTGIVYGYFADKRDILVCVLDIYIKNVFAPVIKIFESASSPLDFSVLISEITDEAINTHKKNRRIHEALHSLSASDEAVNNAFITLEDNFTVQISDHLIRLGVNTENIVEKVHFSMDVIQSFSHEFVFDKHEYIDYSVMRKMVTDSVIKLFG